MLENEDYSGSGSESPLSSSPGSSKSNGAMGGSALFKTVLEDIVLDAQTRISKSEFERYKHRLENKHHHKSEDHTASNRCDSCQAVYAFCKCDLYDGTDRKFGHRVHWADEIYNRPLMTVFEHHQSENGLDNERHIHVHHNSHHELKPILKHTQTCVVIISE